MPLSSVRVLDLTDDRGQYAGFVLAQLGADVVCVEPPEGQRSRRVGPFIDDAEGDDTSLFHWSYNRGKRSVVADDAELSSLAASADVVLDCGALSVDLAGMRAENPGLITARISPFGESGPKQDWLATDLIVAAAGGVMSVTGDKDRPPVRIGHPQSWLYASADAAAAISIALHERSRSGRGQHIDVSAQQSMLSATQFSMMNTLVGGNPAMRVAGGLEMAPFKMRFVYECLDGHVSITYLFGPVIGPYTNRLFAWMHEEGACSDELAERDWVPYAMEVIEGTAPIEALTDASAAIDAWARTRRKWDLVHESMERGALIAPISTTRDILELEHLRVRDYWEAVEMPGRDEPVPVPGPHIRLSASPGVALGRPPGIGEHTAAVLAEPRVPPVVAAPGGDGDQPALAGVKVCDLMWALAGPGTTRTLADFGATVVRIESEHRPEVLRAGSPFIADDGDFEGSLQYHSSNAGKYHLALNLGVPESRDVLLDMVRWADVVTESFAPRAMRNMGLGYEVFKEVNPDIIMVSSCLMGQTGPMRDYAGFGTAGAAMAGFYPITGWPDRLPAGPYTAYTDYISPRLTVVAILAALAHRRDTGEGQYIDFSQMESAIHLLGPLILDDAVNGRVASRHGNRDRDMVPHVVVRCGDPDADQWLAVACETDAQWRTLAEIIGVGELADLSIADRHARVDELEELLSQWASGRDPELTQVELQQAGVPAHQVQNSAEVTADPQLLHLEQFLSVPHQVHGHSFVEAPAYRLSRTPGTPAWAGPTLGEHTHHVLTDFLGYDDERFTELLLAGALE